MKIVAVIGAVGGAGATTLVAQLAAALSSRQHTTLAFDFCVENRLRLHFGMSLTDRYGWATALLKDEQWHDFAYRSSSGVDFVPFGEFSNEAELERLVERMRHLPLWFGTQVNLLRLAAGTIVICDCPRMPPALREQVLSVADLVLMVTDSDSVSYATTVRAVNGCATKNGSKMVIVLNGFDATRQLDRDIAVLLRTQHRQNFSPSIIHQDESLREALACKQTVFDFAPLSQAAYDFSSLATWTLARLEKSAEKPQ